MNKKRIILVMSDKGGTGKSLFSRGLTDYLLRQKLQEQLLLVDGDGEVGQLLQYYGDYGVISTQVISAEHRDQFIEVLESGRKWIVADLPAAALTHLHHLEQEVGFLNLVQEYGYQLTFCNVLSPFKASLRSVKGMVEFAGSQADYVVVKNHFFGGDEEFHLYEAGQGKKLLEEQGGQEIFMPPIATGVLAQMDVQNLSFIKALKSTELKLAYRCRISQWQHSFDQQLASINWLKDISSSSNTKDFL